MATLLCAVPAAANAATRNVPGTYATIQAAVNAAANGDTVLVAAGTYTGTGNVDVDTSGKSITIQGAGATSTIINLNASSSSEHQAFFIHTGETSSTVIQGFTIENGYQGSGGAINITGASPTITQCIFLNNTASGAGGAVYIYNGGPTISQCVFSGNQTGDTGDFGQLGGAVEIINQASAGTLPKTVTLVNDSFISNAAGADGAAVDITGEDPSGNAVSNNLFVTIDNCSFSKNTAHSDGNGGTGGAVDFFGGKATISNCILYGDTGAHEFSSVNTVTSGSTVQYSDIQGGYTGTGAGSGIINADPDFDISASEYLRVEGFSPTINAGATSTQVSTEPTVDLLGNMRDANIDMGAYEYKVAGSPTTFTATQGTAFSGQVASFNDTEDDQTPTGSFTATIDWGDGTASAGTVTQPGGSGTPYVVSGTHTYATSGSMTVKVSFTDSNPDGPAVSNSESASETVGAAAATGFTVSAPASAAAGTAFNFTVTATNSFGTATGYTGTVHFTSTDGSAALPADATLTNGVGTFSATLKSLGSQTITATDTAASSITGTSGAITVGPGAATQLVVTGPNPVPNWTSIQLTVTALDQFGNTATGYNGTVAFTSSDPGFTNPGTLTLTNGTGTIGGAALRTAGTQTVTATDTGNSSITGTGSFTVNPGPVSGFTVSAPSTVTAGTPFNFSVTAHDIWGNATPSYSGTVHFTTTDRFHRVPASGTITAGTGTFQATLGAVGTQTITATDTVNSLTGTSNEITVTHGSCTQFNLRVRSLTVTNGAPFALNVLAYDAYGNLVPDYAGTIHFTSTDPAAVLPADAALSGQGTFAATLGTLGGQNVTATDTATPGITGSIALTVVNNPAAWFRVVPATTAATAGTPITLTVTAYDAAGNVARGYTGTVHFVTADPNAVLPADTPLANGTGTFPVTFKTAGRYWVTVTDTATSSLTGQTGFISVSPGAATHLTATAAQTSAVSGHAFGVVIEALDSCGNRVGSCTDTVHLTSTDPNAVLPADPALYTGRVLPLVTLKTLGSQTVTVSDVTNPSVTSATTGAVTVTAH